MNHPAEWKRFYHPKRGRYFYKHKGTGVVTDSLFKIGNVLKKPLINLAKKVGKKAAEKGAEKVSTVVVKKAGDKIEKILRNRAKPQPQTRGPVIPRAKPQTTARSQTPSNHHEDLLKLNNLISQL